MVVLILKEMELLMLAGNPSKQYTATIEIGEITFEAVPVDCFTAWLKFESNSEDR